MKYRITSGAQSTIHRTSDFMSKLEVEDLMIPPHPTHKICNRILLALYRFVLQVMVNTQVEENLEDWNCNNERKRKNLSIYKSVIYFPQHLQFSRIKTFQASLQILQDPYFVYSGYCRFTWLTSFVENRCRSIVRSSTSILLIKSGLTCRVLCGYNTDNLNDWQLFHNISCSSSQKKFQKCFQNSLESKASLQN